MKKTNNLEKKGKKRWDKRRKCYEGVGMNGSKMKGAIICSEKREKRFKREIREE
jgi:hypothetical protein